MPVINFDYDAVPTVGQFAASDAFVRGLLGPFGCLPGDTEFLTPHGWKRMDAYESGDLVAQWDQSGHIEFVAPLAYQNLPATEFIQFDCGTSLRMRLSEQHRVPHLDYQGRFTVRTALEIEEVRSRRTLITTFVGQPHDGLGMSDDMIRFAVMMHADGHYPKAGKRAQVCVRKDRKKTRIRALLDRMGVEFSEHSYARRPTETTFSFVAPYTGKTFDRWWWGASQRELAVVLDEMRYWDGHDGEILIYSSAHESDADFIQYCAHANGLRAVITRVDTPTRPNQKPNYRVAIRMADNHKNRACIREETKISRAPSLNGRMYCFTVPAGFFVARCEGTIFVTGNSGKSSGCVMEFPERGRMQVRGPDGKRKTRFAVVRNTVKQLEDTTIKTLFQWLPPAYFGRYTSNDHRYVIKALPECEIEILFRALDRPEHIKNLLSLDLTGAWINEAREVPWAIVEAMMGRVGRYPAKVDGGCTWSGIWMDTNPPEVDSKWYKFFEEENWRDDFDDLKRAGSLPPSITEPDDFARIFKQPAGTSPNAENLENLPPGYYARLGIGKTDEWKKVYILGQYGFVTDNKTVFPEYRDDLHLRELDPLPGVTIERNWDWGLTPACTFSQMQPNGRWLIFAELIATQMGADRFSDDVLEYCARVFKPKSGQSVTFSDIGDPSGDSGAQTDERTCFEIVQGKGINIYGGEQNLQMRLESLRKPLMMLGDYGGPRIAIHPRCTQTRKAFMGAYYYRRMATNSERYSTEPEKNHPYSDLMDGLEYRAVEHFGHLVVRDMPQEGPPQRQRDNAGRSKVTGY